MRSAGGEVWVGDETAVREFPPLRAAWSKRGQQAVVVISGRNGRRTIFGALQAASGDLVAVVRERARTADAVRRYPQAAVVQDFRRVIEPNDREAAA